MASSTTYYNTVQGRIISQHTGGVETSFLTDALGSVTATVDQNATIVNQYRYKPYGERLLKTGVGADPRFQWLGSAGARDERLTFASVYASFGTYGSQMGVTANRAEDLYWNGQGYATQNSFTSSPNQGVDSALSGGILGLATCYVDDGCGSCVRSGLTGVKPTNPYCKCTDPLRYCYANSYLSGANQHLAAYKISNPKFSWWSQVKVVKVVFDGKKWVDTLTSVLVTVVDSGELPHSKDDPPGWERIIDLRTADSIKLSASSCGSAKTKVRGYRVGYSCAESEPICWNSVCHKRRVQRPYTECFCEEHPLPGICPCGT